MEARAGVSLLQGAIRPYPSAQHQEILTVMGVIAREVARAGSEEVRVSAVMHRNVFAGPRAASRPN